MMDPLPVDIRADNPEELAKWVAVHEALLAGEEPPEEPSEE